MCYKRNLDLCIIPYVKVNTKWLIDLNIKPPDVEGSGLEKAKELEIKLPTFIGSQRKQRNSRKKHLFLCHWLCWSLWPGGSQQTEKLWKRWEYQTTFPVFWENYMWVKKQQEQLDMEQWTSSKLGKEYDKAVPCHPACLTYM